MATAAESMRSFHQRMVKLHQATEIRHRVAAELHAGYLEAVGAARSQEPPTLPPAFMTAVAKTAGIPSLAVTLYCSDGSEAAVVTSDSVAVKAHDFEYLFGEGPSWMASGSLAALNVYGQSALERRWPEFGSAARDLGVHAVVAARLGTAAVPVGILTAYRPEPEPDAEMARSVRVIAEALTTTALHPDTRIDSEDGLPAHPLFDDIDLRVAVHQATGMVMAAHDCGAPDALAMIRAHAFAQDENVTEVAQAIVSRTSSLS
nr:ANTAR domain-containing protein [Amycolatopsis umgeniensis]